MKNHRFRRNAGVQNKKISGRLCRFWRLVRQGLDIDDAWAVARIMADWRGGWHQKQPEPAGWAVK